MQKRTIGVMGAGFVGSAVARGFMEWGDVVVHDIKPERSAADWMTAASADFVFLCLPTELGDHGTYNTDALDDFFERYIHACCESEEFRQSHVRRTLIIKSTVSPGYTESKAQSLDQYGIEPYLVHNPEFLTARCALADFQTPSRHLIGAVESPYDTLAAERLETLYLERFPGVPVLIMRSVESELAKLGCNAFFATKVAFFNVMERAATDYGVEFGQVRAGMLTDGRIAHAHTEVPGPDGKRGFGGACLPKDLAALTSAVRSSVDRNWLGLTYELNRDHHRPLPERDTERKVVE